MVMKVEVEADPIKSSTGEEATLDQIETDL